MREEDLAKLPCRVIANILAKHNYILLQRTQVTREGIKKCLIPNSHTVSQLHGSRKKQMSGLTQDKIFPRMAQPSPECLLTTMDLPVLSEDCLTKETRSNHYLLIDTHCGQCSPAKLGKYEIPILNCD